jgi:transcriptional regulator with XRE-family HTH domain
MPTFGRRKVRDQIPTIRSRQLGAELRSIRQRAGYSTIELSRVLGWSSSRVSRLEAGTRGTAEVHVAAWLGVCRVTGAEFDAVIGLCRDAREWDWLQSHAPLAHDSVRTLLHLETTAAQISDYEPLVVPSLLQTEDYIRALLGASGLVAPDTVDERARARLARQSIFCLERPPVCRFYLAEQVLSRPVGGGRVMYEQLQHLLRVAARPHCTIRVLPLDDVGPGMAFRLMDYTDQPPCGYLRYLTGSLFLGQLDDLDTYRAHLRWLDRHAWEPDRSREALQTWASGYAVPDPIPNTSHTAVLNGQKEIAR